MIRDNLTLLKTYKKNMKKIKKDNGHSKLSRRKAVYKKRSTNWKDFSFFINRGFLISHL